MSFTFDDLIKRTTFPDDRKRRLACGKNVAQSYRALTGLQPYREEREGITVNVYDDSFRKSAERVIKRYMKTRKLGKFEKTKRRRKKCTLSHMRV